MAWRERLPAAGLIVGALVLWELSVRLFAVPKYLLPAPTLIGSAVIDSFAVLLTVHTPVTLAEAGLGLAMSVAAGVLSGALLHTVPWVRRAVYPVLVVSQTVPVIVLAPLLVIWFGYGILPKLLVVTIACYFPIAVAVVDGLGSADPGMLKLLRTMGAGRLQQFWKVEAPSALPSFFTGLRVAATYSVMGAVIAEWMGSDAGLGMFIVRSARSFRTEQVFAGILLVSLYSIGAFLIVDAARRRSLPWEAAARGEKGVALPAGTSGAK